MEVIDQIEHAIGSHMLGFIISLAIGLIVGLEREFDRLQGQSGIAGIRTFPIISVLGFLIARLSDDFTPWLAITGLGGLFLFLGVSQLQKVRKEWTVGITTNMALIVTYILGIMVFKKLYQEAVAAAVILVTLLSLKTTFQSFIKNITSEELFAFIKFAIIALLILPLLPNEHYGPNGLLNPFEIGLVVVIVSFLDFFGYFLVKFVGSRTGILLTAVLGGLISSTTVAWNYASKSKQNPELSREYSAGISIASAIMFPRIGLLAALFNPKVAMVLVVPLALLTFAGLIPSFFLIRKKPKNTESPQIGVGNPLNIQNALTFAVIYVVILHAVHYGNEFFGESGLYYSSIIAGLADTTAISIGMAKFGLDEAYITLSAMVILAGALSNTLVKMIISFAKGSKETSKYVGIIFGASIVLGIVYILIAS